MNIEYILNNEIDRKQCRSCFGMWIRFNHEGQLGVYRLSPVDPQSCNVCRPLDDQLESQSILTSEQWVNL